MTQLKKIISSTCTRERKDLLFAFCLYSPMIAGFISLPGIFLNWWKIYVTYPSFIISFALFLPIIILCLMSKKQKRTHLDPPISSVNLGHIIFTSRNIYFNDSCKQATAECIIINEGKYNLFTFLNKEKDSDFLVLTQRVEVDSLEPFLSNSATTVDIVVNSGCLYVFSDTQIELIIQPIPSIKKISKKHNTGIIIIPTFGDGAYRVKMVQFDNDCMLLIELIEGALEEYEYTLHT
jgi:hypothetical protein